MIHQAVAEYLGSVVAGLAYSESSPEGNVFVDQLPPTPDQAVALFVTQGPSPDAGLPYDPVSFDVMIRDKPNGVWARATWEAVYSALHALRGTTLPDGTVLVFLLADQATPEALGDDQNGRPRYTGGFHGETLTPTKERPA